jgi:hypothetical protein
MKIRRLRTSVGMTWIMALCLAGCHTAQPAAPSEAKMATERAAISEEARGVAETALGQQAEILAQGDLAQNGREQVFIVNRLPKASPASEARGNPSSILITRAAILEKNGGKWSEVLLCDEHLKNLNGYLGGSPAARVSGWRLEYSQDAKQGLEMKFTPAERFDAMDGNADQNSQQKRPTFEVRWNKNAKRYQSFDQSHERYLSEVPSLETPESTLK